MSLTLAKLQQLQAPGRWARRRRQRTHARRTHTASRQTNAPRTREHVDRTAAAAAARARARGGAHASRTTAHCPATRSRRACTCAEEHLPDDAIPDQFCGAFDRKDALTASQLLFFDTETTGLAGGTGTRAFMIGAADWHGGALRIRQLTIATMAAETAMLDAFRAWLSPDTMLVSYNGKCYDAPLLATRYRLARQTNPLAGLAHVDLLYPSRRH